MPSRVIRGEINASRSLARVGLFADLTFRALLVSVDDFGRAEADPLMLKAELFPRRIDVTPAAVRGWVDELAREGCVQLYAVEGVEYLQLTGWEKHRSNGRRAARSKFPDPPPIPRKSEEPPGDPVDDSEIRPSDVLRLASDEGRVSSVGGAGGHAAAAPPPAASAAAPAKSDLLKRPPKRSEPTPPCPDALTPEQMADLHGWCAKKARSELPLLEMHVEACLDWHRAHPNPRRPIRDWPAACRTWIRRAPEMRRGQPAPAPPPAERTPQEEAAREQSALERARGEMQSMRDRRAGRSAGSPLAPLEPLLDRLAVGRREP